MNCRHCNTKLSHLFIDLGFAPPSNEYLKKQDLNSPEVTFPLRVFVCHNCWLVQTEDYSSADELFKSDYAYFSSTSSSWLVHAKKYTNNIIKRLNLDNNSYVIEVASNDGYLLKNFVSKKIPCLGIEPTISAAKKSEKLGIKVIKEFFGIKLANKLSNKKADLICGNNVYAHVPDINDFTNGIRILLKDEGTVTFEIPHLLKLIEYSAFDTIYHEHYSYISLISAAKIFQKAGLRIYDVEELDTHGGSIRIYGCHKNAKILPSSNVDRLLKKENKFGLNKIETYNNFKYQVNLIKNKFINFLIKQKNNNKKIVAYGAAAKGNTLLNYSGIKNDLIDYVYDAAPSKQNKFLPGSHIPILHPDHLKVYKPDWIIIFPWNLSKEIKKDLKYIKSWGGKFVVFIPKFRIFK